MYVKEGHEDADLQGVLFKESIFRACSDVDHSAIRGREDGVFLIGYVSPRVSKKIGDEQCEKDSKRGQDRPTHPHEDEGQQEGRDQKWESFFGDRPALVHRSSFFSFSQVTTESRLAGRESRAQEGSVDSLLPLTIAT